MNHSESLYENIGGQAALERLVEAFYQHVAKHPQLKPIFPEDLSETRRKQKQFLTQFFGGPPLYTEEHGHPKLRYRHLPFEITTTLKNAWLSCMAAALEETGIEEPYNSIIFERLALTAHHMINTPEEEKGESI